MSGFAKFQKSLLGVLAPRALALLHENREAMMQSLGADIFGEGADQLVPMRNPAPDDVFINFLRAHFAEISDSLANLETVQFFLKRYSRSATNVPPSTYVRYHVEAYFNEIYLLHNRLRNFFTRLKRAYRNAAAHDAIGKVTTKLDEAARNSFAGIVRTRGGHVHQSCFEDAALRRLSLLDLLAKSGDPEFARMYREAQRDVRRQKVAWIRDNNATIKRLVDSMFGIVHDIVFTPEGQIVLPRRSR